LRQAIRWRHRCGIHDEKDAEHAETIAHIIHGHGPVRVIALHGWFADHTAFDALLPALDPARFTIALPDYRGYGASRPSSGPFNLDTVADDALALADRLGWARFAVMGHSMGGKAALRLALAAPERVERIVGITPAWAGAAPFDPDTLALFRGAAASLDMRRAIIDGSTGGRLPACWVDATARASVRLSEQDAFAAYFGSWSGGDFAQAASAITHEVLVIAGRRMAACRRRGCAPPGWLICREPALR
jgi:pimeloyl-ACP methyl ester carboxylesterase